MDKKKTNFEKNWQEKFLNHSEEVSDNLWKIIEEKRNEKKKEFKINWFYPAIGIAASLVLIFNFIQNQETQPDQLEETSIKTIQTEVKNESISETIPSEEEEIPSIKLVNNEAKKISKEIIPENKEKFEEEKPIVHSKTFLVNSPVKSEPQVQFINNDETNETTTIEEIPIQVVTVSLEEKTVDDVIIIQVKSESQDKETRKKLVKNILNGIGKVLDGTYSMDNEKLIDIKSKKSL
ncbi:MAG: hypothetical protein RIR51_1820 [Bacteroidota bacterium]|jgi:hypothetical protein